MEAFDKRDWETAARRFSEAILAQPDEGGRRVNLYGMRYEDYLPHYFLGVARQQMQDLRGAEREFAESERQGFVLSTRWGEDLRSRRAEVAAALPPPTPEPLAIAALPLPESDRSAGTIDQTVARSPGSSLEVRVAEPAGAPVEAPGASEAGGPAVAASSGDAALLSGPPVISESDQVAARAAARLFFSGDYEAALRALVPLADTSAPACVLHAASDYYLSRTAPERRAQLERESARRLRRCRSLVGFQEPSSRYFSPSFLRFAAGSQ